MWLKKLFRIPENPELLRLKKEISERKLAMPTADEDTALSMLRDNDPDVRLAARNRVAQLRWSKGFRAVKPN